MRVTIAQNAQALAQALLKERQRTLKLAFVVEQHREIAERLQRIGVIIAQDAPALR